MIRLYVSDGVQLFQESSKEAEAHVCIFNINPIILQAGLEQDTQNVIVMNRETKTFVSPKAVTLTRKQTGLTECVYSGTVRAGSVWSSSSSWVFSVCPFLFITTYTQTIPLLPDSDFTYKTCHRPVKWLHCDRLNFPTIVLSVGTRVQSIKRVKYSRLSSNVVASIILLWSDSSWFTSKCCPC